MVVLASAVFFLVNPPLQCSAEHTLVVLRDPVFFCGTCERHGSQDKFSVAPLLFSGKSDAFCVTFSKFARDI